MQLQRFRRFGQGHYIVFQFAAKATRVMLSIAKEGIEGLQGKACDDCHPK